MKLKTPADFSVISFIGKCLAKAEKDVSVPV